MRYVDAHVHLSDPEFASQLDAVIDDAKRADVVALVSNSVDVPTSLRNIELAEMHPGLVYAALGIHPWNVKELRPGELNQAVDLVSSHKQSEKVVAVGEVGLDYKYAKQDRASLMAKQYEVFCTMLSLSEKQSLPIIIHSRGATQEIMDMLPSYHVERVLLHLFSNPIEAVPTIVERGYYITEGPAATFSDHIREIVRQIPLDRLLTETDGPVRFFRPPFKGKMATPADIPLVVRTIAEIKDSKEPDVAEAVFRNFETFFGVKQDPGFS